MHVAENLLAAGLAQLPRLGLDALAFSAGRYPRIAILHGQTNLCKGKVFLGQGSAFLAKFLGTVEKVGQ
jgi:hypothetical protein